MKFLDYFKKKKEADAPYIKIACVGDDITIECNINKNPHDIENFIKLIYYLQAGDLTEAIFYAIQAGGEASPDMAQMTNHIIESIIKLHESEPNEETSNNKNSPVVEPLNAFKGKHIDNDD